ncbi:MAG TPA: hypothetical protein VGN54_00885 [Mycobacteriales bacterium]|jgi:hypothetical protein|nr:hypothetical protein [Mycobacteriales bacterium]
MQGLPELFLDRSHGRLKVPPLLRVAGQWLAHAGRNGWPVLMKDERIRYRPAERAAVIAFDVQTFCLTNGNLRAATTAGQFLGVIEQIAEKCRERGPFLYTVSDSGIRRIDL